MTIFPDSFAVWNFFNTRPAGITELTMQLNSFSVAVLTLIASASHMRLEDKELKYSHE
jgi:hypothetical protein